MSESHAALEKRVRNMVEIVFHRLLQDFPDANAHEVGVILEKLGQDIQKKASETGPTYGIATVAGWGS